MFDYQPKLLTFAQLLEKRLFRIPRYQRAYSWQSSQRRDMFKDIKELMLKSRDSHFMATVVGLYQCKVPIGSADYEKIEIVDGQQRLTTLVILLKIIAEKLALLLNDADSDGSQNSVIYCVATRNTSPKNVDKHFLTSSGIGFGKNPLQGPSNTFPHSQVIIITIIVIGSETC